MKETTLKDLIDSDTHGLLDIEPGFYPIEVSIDELIEVAKKGVPILQKAWGQHCTYIKYDKSDGEWYFVTYDNYFCYWRDKELINEETARFSLT
jgi:hypothetical protein